MTIILANAIIRNNHLCPDNDRRVSSSHLENHSTKPPAAVNVKQQLVMLAEVIKMNDDKEVAVTDNKIPCDSGEINNNYDSEMGVKYHRFRLDEMSPTKVPKDQTAGDTVESDNGRRSAVAMNRIDNGVSPDNDNDRGGGPSSECANDDDEDEDVDDGDNDSVLSVGRDENNFEELQLPKQQRSSSISSMDIEDHDSHPPHPPPRNHMPLQSDFNGREGPLGHVGPFSPQNPVDPFNLGLSFRNIQNHLTSLKNYSPLDVFASPSCVSPGSLFKNSAFRSAAAANGNSFPGAFPTLNNPTAELLHRYDVLRGSFHRPGMNYSQRDEDNLKFSIDNILKADFGRRRITDPINKLRKISNTLIQNANLPQHSKLPSSCMSPTSSTASNSSASSPVLQSPPPSSVAGSSSFGDSPTKVFSPIDLTAKEDRCKSSPLSKNNGEKGDSRTTATPGATGKGGKDSSSGSGAPMVWPAWVYCTRYSDRPSSG